MMPSPAELAHAFRFNNTHKKAMKNNRSYIGNSAMMGFDAHSTLTIRLPDPRLLRVIARSVFLALVIVSFPWLGSIFGKFYGAVHLLPASDPPPPMENAIDSEQLSLIFQDLTNEGLLKLGDRVLFTDDEENYNQIRGSQILIDNNEMDFDLVSISDHEHQSSIPDNSFDLAFANGPAATMADFIGRTLKTDGVAAVRLAEADPSRLAFPNFKMVYLRRFEDSTVVAALRKGSGYGGSTVATRRRRLLGFESEEKKKKKKAMKKLENVLLEPPRAASGKSWRYLKRTRYLPDLMGDSLEKYPRRVFINVGGGGDSKWFARNYPTRNKDFELYEIEMVEQEKKGNAAKWGLSEWVRKNVKEEDYVVMKAEAEAAEEMMRSSAMKLVDELFLECKPRGSRSSRRHGRGERVADGKNRRPYWECLALYGRLRDEGVAVHQWWG